MLLAGGPDGLGALGGAGRPGRTGVTVEDIDTGPGRGALRFGLVRDTGMDSAPVPQYVTRATPADPATVPQRPRVQRAARRRGSS